MTLDRRSSKAHEAAAPVPGTGASPSFACAISSCSLPIHEHKSITSAALQLGLTQPAASRALKDMEQLCAPICSSAIAPRA